MKGKKIEKAEINNFYKVLREKHGFVTPTCKATGISTTTFYRWKENNSEFRKTIEEIQDCEIGIIAEDRMFEAIVKKKDMGMVRFYLQSRVAKYNQKTEPPEEKDEALVELLNFLTTPKTNAKKKRKTKSGK